MSADSTSTFKDKHEPVKSTASDCKGSRFSNSILRRIGQSPDDESYTSPIPAVEDRAQAVGHPIARSPEEEPKGKHVPYYPAMTFDVVLARSIADAHHPSNAQHCNGGMIDVQTVAGLTGKTVYSYYKNVQRGTGLQPDLRTPDKRMWYNPRRVALAAAPPTEDELPIVDLVERAGAVALSTRAALAQALYDTQVAAARSARKTIAEMQERLDAFSNAVDETTSVEEFERFCSDVTEFFDLWEWIFTRNQPRDPGDPRWQRRLE